MNKIISIFPSSNADENIAFYKALGFALKGTFNRGYYVLTYKEVELHFYASIRLLPKDNPTMALLHTDELESLYDNFTTSLKNKRGSIPRSGFPKITKIRELSEDRRFTISDASGNTIYVTQTNEKEVFLRELENTTYKERFRVLYDLIYSKEDLQVAYNLLVQLKELKEVGSKLDKAKYFVLENEILKGLHLPMTIDEVESLWLEEGEEWDEIRKILDDVRKD